MKKLIVGMLLTASLLGNINIVANARENNNLNAQEQESQATHCYLRKTIRSEISENMTTEPMIMCIETEVDGGNGEIASNKTEITGDEEAEITFTPDEGYVIDTVTMNDVDITSEVQDNKLILKNLEESVKVVVKYKIEKKINVTVDIDEGVELDQIDNIVIKEDSSVEITVTLKEDYELDSAFYGSDQYGGTIEIVDGKVRLTYFPEDTKLVIRTKKIQNSGEQGTTGEEEKGELDETPHTGIEKNEMVTIAIIIAAGMALTIPTVKFAYRKK